MCTQIGIAPSKPHKCCAREDAQSSGQLTTHWRGAARCAAAGSAEQLLAAPCAHSFHWVFPHVQFPASLVFLRRFILLFSSVYRNSTHPRLTCPRQPTLSGQRVKVCVCTELCSLVLDLISVFHFLSLLLHTCENGEWNAGQRGLCDQLQRS